MVIRYWAILPYCVIISSTTWCNTATSYSTNRNNCIIYTTKLLDKVRKSILEKIGYWVTKNPNRNFRVPKFQLSECFGLDTVHHFVDQKFGVPEPKSPSTPLVLIHFHGRKD